MSDTESFESVASSYDNYTWIGRDGVKRAIDRLKAAHDREIEELRKTYDLALAQARDPQRLRGTKPSTFDGAIEALREFRWQHATNDEDAIPYINAVKEMHDREIRDTAQQQYHRGFEDGQHSMDAEHRAVAMRLRGLRFDGGSHENLSRIAYAIYPCATGWTCESADGLRDKLIDLLGGVSDDTCCCAGGGACDADCGDDSGKQEEVEHGGAAHDSASDSRGGSGSELVHMAGVTYDPLWNERHEAVRVLRKLLDRNTSIWNTEISIALGLNIFANNAAVCRRLIHLLGGDQPSGIDVLREMDAESDDDGTCPNDDTTSSITDELRECVDTASKSYDNTPWYDVDEGEEADHTTCHITEGELLRIADSIDEQFGRICHQQEVVLQETIAEVVEERDHWHQRATDLMNRADAMEHERNELRRKVDELESFDPETSIAVFGDDNGKLRRTLSRAATLLANAEQDRDANYAYWMDCKEKVVHANATIEELQAKLDEYDRTHVELPKDANGNVIFTGHSVRTANSNNKDTMMVYSLTLTFKGWSVYASGDKYAVEREPSFFEVCEPKSDTAESIVRDLSMGIITELQAIERIEALDD